MAKEEKIDYKKPDFWLTEIRRAEQKREIFRRRYEWDKIKELWDTGGKDATLTQQSNRTQPTPFQQTAYVNWPWAFAQMFIPAVYWRQPQINVRPQKPAHLVGSRFVGPLINAAIRLCKFREACRRALCDVLCYGHGWIKVGWFTQMGDVPNRQGVEGKGLSTTFPEANLIRNAPYTYRVSPDHMCVDPEATTYDDARWMAQEYWRTKEEVMADPNLKHKKNIVASIYRGDDDEAILPLRTTSDYHSKENRWVRIFEIWDRERGRVMIHCNGSKEFNRIVEPWPYRGLYGFPFKFLAVTDSIDDFYPLSPILPWLPLVEELAFLRSIRLEHIAKMVKKILVPPGSFDEEQLKKFLDPREDVVEANNLELVKDFDGLRPDPNLYASEEQVTDNIREISGFGEILSGNMPFSRIPATGAAIMERNATIRFDQYAERVGGFILECAQDLFKIVRLFQPYPQQIEIAAQPIPQWMEFSREEIEGEYYFDLDLEELSVSSKQQRIKQDFDAVSACAPFQQDVKIRSLLRDLLFSFGKTDLMDYMNPPAGPPLDPNFENQQMLQGVPIDPNPNEDHRLHLMIHAAFIEQSPEYQHYVRPNQQLAALFSEHVQKTTRMLEAEQQMGGKPQPQGAPRMTPGIQQGQQNITSSPPVMPQGGSTGGGAQAAAAASQLPRS